MDTTRKGVGRRGGHVVATGGGGTVLEHHFGTVLLAHLLAKEPCPQLGIHLLPTFIGFQDPVCSVDDFRVEGTTGNGEQSCVAVAVRRRPKLAPGDPDSVKLVKSFLETVLVGWEEIRDGRLGLCLVVSNPCIPAQQLRVLAHVAKGQTDQAHFDARLPSATDNRQRKRLEQMKRMVENLLPQLSTELSADELLWRTLHGLHVHESRLEDDQPDDRFTAHFLIRHGLQIGHAQAPRVYEALFGKASDYAPQGARVDERRLRADLRGLPEMEIPASTDAVGVDVEAAINGPLQSLGLQDQFHQATACVADNPEQAASLFASVAEGLKQNSAYAAFALDSQRRQAQALRQAADVNGSVRIDLDVMAAELASGEAGLAARTGWRLLSETDNGKQVDSALMRSVDALLTLAVYETDHNVHLQDVADAVDALQGGDLFRHDALLMLAEYALANGTHTLIQERSAALKSVADAATGPLHRARILACLADTQADTTWTTTIRAARELDPPGSALLYARQGCYLARAGRGDEAITAYQQAIDLAFKAPTVPMHDAADWLEAQTLVRARHRFDLDQLAGAHLMPAALRRTGAGMLLARAISARERALARLADPDAKPADVLQALTRYRLEALLTGAWQRETEADRLLGEFHLHHGEATRAWPHLLAARETQSLAAYAIHVVNQSFDLPPPEPGIPPGQLIGLCSLAGAVADVMTDDQAQAWITALIPHLGPVVQREVRKTAFMALAALVPAASTEQARQLVDATRPMLDGRARGSTRVTDEAHATVLKAVAHHHPSVRAAAVEQMCHAINQDLTRFVRHVLNDGRQEFREEAPW